MSKLSMSIHVLNNKKKHLERSFLETLKNLGDTIENEIMAPRIEHDLLVAKISASLKKLEKQKIEIDDINIDVTSLTMAANTSE